MKIFLVISLALGFTVEVTPEYGGPAVSALQKLVMEDQLQELKHGGEIWSDVI